MLDVRVERDKSRPYSLRAACLWMALERFSSSRLRTSFRGFSVCPFYSTGVKGVSPKPQLQTYFS